MDHVRIAGPDRDASAVPRGRPLNARLAQAVEFALRINLHRRQAVLAERVLPRQLAAWAPLADRVILTVDSRPDILCRGRAYREARKRLFLLLEAQREAFPGLGIDGVAYAAHFRAKVADRFFGGAVEWPDHACDGSPFHGLFFGLMRANARYVLHLAPDALPRGAEAEWLARARARLARERSLLAVVSEAGPGHCALFDMERFAGMGPLVPRRPGLWRRITAMALGRESSSLPAMTVIEAARQRAGLALALEDGGTPTGAAVRQQTGSVSAPMQRPGQA